MSEATKSRSKITFEIDGTTLLKLSEKLGLVGVFWSGKLKLRSSIQLVVLYAVIGEGKLLITLDKTQRAWEEVQRATPVGHRDGKGPKDAMHSKRNRLKRLVYSYG